ncbi:MAG: AAA family ATPase [Desulfobacterales bacterium]|uniref:AAA family ATPase n=1 Tax=Candidatus Desulfatibia vada TaxID=2841696 RepID=A0A8J6TSY2_9BACT|nr:AAA family ATPase [Candidatus Desulfatibia vada]
MTESLRVTVEEIRLQRFRAFENARLVLSDLTFLVGRNGAGKSSLLDAVDLLRESVSDSLENALDRRGGLQKVQRAKPGRGKKTPMGIAVVFRIVFPGDRQARVVYGFEVQDKKTGGSSHIRECFMYSKGTSFERKDQTFDSERKPDVSPPAGNLVLPLVARSDSLWESVLNTIRNMRAYELSPGHMASATEIGERSTLTRDGANAGDVLKAIEGTAAHRWMVERLGIITDGINDVRAEALMGRRVVRFFQKSETVELNFDASQVSQGTLRSLGVLLALKQSPLPSVVLVDEIENSVHPSALAVLLDAALASSDDTRVVLTSHSPEVLSHPAVTGERVRVVEWRNGNSRIFSLSPETQASVNDIDTVGWMLRSNALWTGPNPETFAGDIFALDNEKR